MGDVPDAHAVRAAKVALGSRSDTTRAAPHGGRPRLDELGRKKKEPKPSCLVEHGDALGVRATLDSVKCFFLFCALILVLGLPVAAGAANPDSSNVYSSEEAIRRYAAGRLLEEAGDHAEALREYYRALALEPRSAGIASRVSELTARSGDAARSLEFAERGLAHSPGDARLLWLRGAALFNLGRAPDALETLSAAAQADSTETEYARSLARVAEQVGRMDIVADAWRRITSQDFDDGEAWFQLASVEARLGNFEAADRALAQAIDLSPQRPGMFFMQGWIREGQGRAQEAIDLYRRHLDIHESDPATRRRLVQLLAREKRWDEAYREAARVNQEQPDDFMALEVLTDLAYRAKRGSDAKRLTTRLRERAGRDEDRLLRVIGLLARNGKGDEGVAIADEWARSAPAPNGDQLAAQARALAGDTRGAIARARAAAGAAPDSLGPRLLLARLHQSNAEYAAAESVWTSMLASGADTLIVLLEIASCREQRGDLAAAESAVRDALRSDPESPRALNFLGYLLADHRQSLPEALQLIQRALAADPDNGAYVDSLGWVYYRLGRLDEARVELERAVRLTGGDPVVHEHLGDVYRDLKLLDLARKQYQLSLSLNGANPQVKAKLAGIR